MLGFRFGLAVVFISLQVLYFLLWGLCLCPFGYLLGFTVMWGFRLCIFLLSWTVFCSLCYIFLPILPKPKAWKPASISLFSLSVVQFKEFNMISPVLFSWKWPWWEMMKKELACITHYFCIFIFLWQLWIWLCIFLWYLGQIFFDSLGRLFVFDSRLHFWLLIESGNLDFQFGWTWTMQFELWILCILHSWIKMKFFPLCEPGEIPWFAERVSWSQSVALNDDCKFYLSFPI